MNNTGIDCLYHPLALAREQIARSLMASSYDRRGGNHDWSNSVRVEGGSAVLMEAEGPGCITRIWTANPQLFGYRLHVPDRMPFVRRGRFTLEHGTGNNCSGLYRSIAYWYMDPAANRTRVEEARWEALRNKP